MRAGNNVRRYHFECTHGMRRDDVVGSVASRLSRGQRCDEMMKPSSSKLPEREVPAEPA
jgi:hypothetical protein